MRAIRIEKAGGPEVLRNDEVEPPSTGPDEVLVEVAYAGINFMDVFTRNGTYETSKTYPVRIPLTLGMEGAGIVRAAGDRVDHLTVGDRVAWCVAWGSYAEFTAVPARLVAKIPDGIGLDVAAATMFQGLTAHYLSHDVAGLGSGSSCLVHAASGSIAKLIIQLAKARGATVYATTSTEGKRAEALSLGVDDVFLYDDGQFADRILEATRGIGVDVVFDAVGRTTLRDSFRATRTKGLVINSGSVSGAISDLNPLELGEAGSLFLTRPRLGDYIADAQTVQRRADAIFGAILDGTVTAKIAGRFDFANIADAHAELEERRQTGKTVLTVNADLQ